MTTGELLTTSVARRPSLYRRVWSRFKGRGPRALLFVGMLVVALELGNLVVTAPQLSLILLALVVGAFALLAPAAAWIIAALVVAIGVRGLVGVHLLPQVASYFDIPLCWGALAAGYLRASSISTAASRICRWLALLGGAMIASWLFSESEPLRPVVYFLLLAEPFALVAALLVDPPSAAMRRALLWTAGALVAIQVPVSFYQFAAHGPGDPVQGTLFGAGAGAHTMSSVAILGAAWLLASANRRNFLWYTVGAGILLVLPLIAQAKQVLFAAPLLLLVGRWRRGTGALVTRIALLGLAALAVILFAPLPHSTVNYIDTAKTGDAGKPLIAKFVWHQITTDPASFVFGKGPAETVSRTAFLTTPAQVNKNASLSALGLGPAQIAQQANALALQASGADIHSYLSTSFNNAQSSGLGLIGDLGLFGAVVFTGLLVSLLRLLWSSHARFGGLAMGSLVMYVLLGFVFDWWEEPPFTIFIGLLVALALTEPTRAAGSQDLARSL